MKTARILAKVVTLSLIIALITFPISTNAQIDTSYTLIVKDEDGRQIGSYFDIRIDSLQVNGNVAADLKMIPNVEIQDSTLAANYGSFLELFKRTVNKDVPAIIDSAKVLGPVSSVLNNWHTIQMDFGDYTYEFLNHSEKARQIGPEINRRTGLNLIQESSTGNIAWDYSSREPTSVEVTTYDENGVPLEGVIHKQNFAVTVEELEKDIRLAYLKLLLLNNFVDENLLTKDGQFTEEAINLLKVKYGKPNLWDMAYDLNEASSSPAAYAEFSPGNPLEGEDIIVDFSKSRFVDAPLKSSSVVQIFGEKESLEYRSGWPATIEDLGDMKYKIIAPEPGHYFFDLTVEDSISMKNVYRFSIEIRGENRRNLYERIILLGDYWGDSLSREDAARKTIEHIRRTYGDKITTICFMDNLQLSSLDPVIIRKTPGDDFRAATKEEVVAMKDAAHGAGYKFMYKSQLAPGGSIDVGELYNNVYPAQFYEDIFQQWKPHILDYLDWIQNNGTKPAEFFDFGHTLGWLWGVKGDMEKNTITPLFKDLIDNEIRPNYGGKVGVAVYVGSDGGWKGPDIKFTDKLDFMVAAGTPPLSNKLDPHNSELYNGFLNVINEVKNFNKIPLFLSFGYNSSDGGNRNIFQEKTDFDEQARIYEVVMKGLNSLSNISGVFSSGYWWTDSFDGDRHGQPYIIQSGTIRNKPAEDVFLKWLPLYK